MSVVVGKSTDRSTLSGARTVRVEALVASGVGASEKTMTVVVVREGRSRTVRVRVRLSGREEVAVRAGRGQESARGDTHVVRGVLASTISVDVVRTVTSDSVTVAV